MFTSNAFVREATPDDANQVLAVWRAVLSEPDHNLIETPDDIPTDEAAERQFIQGMCNDGRSLMLVAEALEDAQIVGYLLLKAHNRPAQRHTARLFINVMEPWRGQGVGTMLIEESLKWARRHEHLRRIELSVISRNTRAMALCLRLGFKIEGCAVGAVYKDDQYFDLYQMATHVTKVPLTKRIPDVSAVRSRY